jgi:sugar lactone lactonase YvrE
MTTIHRLHPHRAILGEGPIWRANEPALYWIDLRQPSIHRFDPAHSALENLPTKIGDRIGGMVFARDGRMVIVDRAGLHLLDRETGRRTYLANPEIERPDNCFNDAKCDRLGRLWSGGEETHNEAPEGRLFVFDHKAQARLIDEGFICSNGPAFSLDGKTAYFTDSFAREIWRYEIDPATGEVGPRRHFATIDPSAGYPDGMTVDSEGCLWNAHWDGWQITCYRPNGKIERVLKVPVPKPTAVAFGGKDMKRLFITTASVGMSEGELSEAPWSGCLLGADLDVAGVPDTDYALDL